MDPLHQFEIKPIVQFVVSDIDLSFSNSAVMMVIAVVLVYGLVTLGMRKGGMVPSRLQSVVELLYEFVVKMVRDNAGADARPFVPFVFTLFTFILAGNLLGMVPGSFTFTSHIVVTFALALTVFVMVTILGFVKHGLHYFQIFIPPGAPMAMVPILIPIEVMSYFVRPLSLSIRLFANMMAGHTMMKVFAGFSVMAIASLGEGFGILAGLFPTAINVALTGLEIFVSMLQAYVFCVLTCLYIRDALYLHH